MSNEFNDEKMKEASKTTNKREKNLTSGYEWENEKEEQQKRTKRDFTGTLRKCVWVKLDSTLHFLDR